MVQSKVPVYIIRLQVAIYDTLYKALRITLEAIEEDFNERP